MKWHDFRIHMVKLCRYYQINPQDTQETMREYYDSWLGKVTEFELSEIVKECKERTVKPEKWGCLPQPYQLKELYQEIRKNRIYDDRKEYTCEVCDDTGYPVITNKQTGTESVVTCSCPKGERINAALRTKKNKNERVFVRKLADVDHVKFNAPKVVPF